MKNNVYAAIFPFLANKKDIDENILFIGDDIFIILNITQIKNDNYIIVLNKPIIFNEAYFSYTTNGDNHVGKISHVSVVSERFKTEIIKANRQLVMYKLFESC